VLNACKSVVLVLRFVNLFWLTCRICRVTLLTYFLIILSQCKEGEPSTSYPSYRVRDVLDSLICRWVLLPPYLSPTAARLPVLRPHTELIWFDMQSYHVTDVSALWWNLDWCPSSCHVTGCTYTGERELCRVREDEKSHTKIQKKGKLSPRETLWQLNHGQGSLRKSHLDGMQKVRIEGHFTC